MKLVFIRNKNNILITCRGITEIITDKNTLLLSDNEIVKSYFERRGLNGIIRKNNDTEYCYQRD